MHVSVASGTALSLFPLRQLQVFNWHSVVCHLWHPAVSTRVLWGIVNRMSATSPLGHTFWRKCQSNNFTSIFYLEEWHAFCEVRVTLPNIAFTYSAPWWTYAFVPALKLPGHSCKARFPLKQQHHMWIHTDLWTQDALYLRQHNESEPEECGKIPARRVFFEKNQECVDRSARVI